MQNKPLNFEPAFLATASLSTLGANLLNSSVTTLSPGGIGFTGTQPYVIVKHLKITNTLTTTAVFVTLFKGASLGSAAGTQFLWTSVSLPAQGGYLDDYGSHRFDSGDYLTGYCNLPQAVVINMDGEIGLS